MLENEKSTPANPDLINAIKRDSLSGVLALLDSGVPAYGVDEDGHLLMDIAEGTKDKLMVEILEKHRTTILS